MPVTLQAWRDQHKARGKSYLDRIDLVIAFLHRHFPGLSDLDTVDRLRGVDFSHPVATVALLKGTRLVSYRDPRLSAYRGTWFTRSGVPLDRLGLNPRSTLKTSPKPLEKVRLEFDVAVPIPEALETIAAAAADKWSDRAGGAKHPAAGGGKQYLVPQPQRHLVEA